MRSLVDLYAWQKGHALVLAVYRATEKFPAKEIFGLVSQLRRAVISITSNIAEGFSRSSLKEKMNFYHISLGSLTEVQNQLLIARDVGYLSAVEYEQLFELTVEVSKIINGLIKASRARMYPPLSS
ncbi:MAG: four helix bundle protein [Candidatus Liptonbacteria bacterium]|nr:four helix bundle protein [Candidatus Liptonbacteria bacterium]